MSAPTIRHERVVSFRSLDALRRSRVDSFHSLGKLILIMLGLRAEYLDLHFYPRSVVLENATRDKLKVVVCSGSTLRKMCGRGSYWSPWFKKVRHTWHAVQLPVRRCIYESAWFLVQAVDAAARAALHRTAKTTVVSAACPRIFASTPGCFGITTGCPCGTAQQKRFPRCYENRCYDTWEFAVVHATLRYAAVRATLHI